MDSIRDIYVIGNGPSSSHTIGPSKGTTYIINKYKDRGIKFINVYLYASFALTGKGHLTDYIIDKRLNESNIDHEIIFDFKTEVNHPNTMRFIITFNDGSTLEEDVVSIGGGTIKTIDSKDDKPQEVYKESKMADILSYCKENNLSLYEYVLEHEGEDYIDYLKTVLKTMDEAVNRGINTEGVLPGSLKVKRKAKGMLERVNSLKDDFSKTELLVSISSFAVAEENANGGVVVTAPTCGSCGVIPGIISYLRLRKYSDDKIIEGLAVAALIGKLIKVNASVSGAVSGCQAEIGAASSMGAALIMYVFGATNEKIEQAAEIALEHSLGLTCDPIKGYVQIPCIERNSIFALKAINAANIALIIDKETNLISFDDIVDTMYRTGMDLHSGYKETSIKGMSEIERFK